MSFQEHFEGKIVMITGVGRGLGRALAKRLHEYGATVYGLSKTAERLNSLKKECPNIITFCQDLTKWEATREVVEKIGPVHYLVNCADTMNYQSFMNVTPEEYDAMSNIKVKAIINISQVVARHMIENEIKGSIVNISSVAGVMVVPDITSHCVLNAALNMLTKVMAVELGPKGIRVNSVCPGGIQNENYDEFLGKTAEKFKCSKEEAEKIFDAKCPIGTIKQNLEAAVNSVLFPLSHMSPVLHGECITFAGGYTLT